MISPFVIATTVVVALFFVAQLCLPEVPVPAVPAPGDRRTVGVRRRLSSMFLSAYDDPKEVNNKMVFRQTPPGSGGQRPMHEQKPEMMMMGGRDGPEQAQRLFLHVTTGGSPRTATTFQFQAACACLFLSVRRHRADLLSDMECTYSGLPVSRYDFKADKPQVIKSHKDFGDVGQNDDATGTLVFTTAKIKQEAVERYNALSNRGYTVGLVQDIETLNEIGERGMLIRYADSFHLNTEQHNDLHEYFSHWEVLRICCGKQMSKHHRNDLLPPQMKNPTIEPHPTCGTHDIDAVERAFLRTKLYAAYDALPKMRVMNKPSLMDGVLDGNYCSKYNYLVTSRGVQFNEGTV